MLALALDLISLSLVGLMFYPVMQYIATLEIIYFYILVGEILCQIAIKITRHFPWDGPIVRRPPAAEKCDVFCRDGNVGHKLGMPSGHMTLTTYIVTCFYLLNPSIAKLWFGIIMIIAMGISRYYKACHNLPQIIAGFLFGGFVAWILFKIVR